MKLQFGEPPSDKDSRASVIRSLFKGGTINSHTDYCMNGPVTVWTDLDYQVKAVKACRDEVREALGELINGRPFAGPTRERAEGEKAPVWRQMELWSKDDYFYNCELRATRIRGGDLEVHNLIARECWTRYGDGPLLLEVISRKFRAGRRETEA